MLSERIDRESVEERQQREAAHARQECIRSAREAEIQCFYCDVCDKQYVKVRGWTLPAGYRERPRLLGDLSESHFVSACLVVNPRLHALASGDRIREPPIFI